MIGLMLEDWAYRLLNVQKRRSTYVAPEGFRLEAEPPPLYTGPIEGVRA